MADSGEPMGGVLASLSGAKKRFGATVALDGLDLDAVEKAVREARLRVRDDAWPLAGEPP